MTSTELQQRLDKLLSDNTYTKIDLDYFVPNHLKTLLTQISDTDLTSWGDFETNGWDNDFWFKFRYKDVNLTFAGSWYYGNYSIYRS